MTNDDKGSAPIELGSSKEKSEKSEKKEEIINNYKRLDKKCDAVLDKIKKRKVKKVA